MNWAEVREALAAIRTLCEAILPIDIDTHVKALWVSERYECATFDALVVAAALRAHCRILWPEDMHDGLIVDGRATAHRQSLSIAPIRRCMPSIVESC
jgi:predicted nucleic acid-binding protein